jgi:hypothetical protein
MTSFSNWLPRARFAVRAALLVLALAACATRPGEEPAPPQAQIHALLDAQQLAWNRGDIEGFMQGYWHNDALRFDSGSTMMLGWQATYDRYRARYPDRAAMGRLEFSDMQITLLDRDHASVTGGWALQRAADRPHGSFVLSIRRFKDDWKIVQDRTEIAP